MRKKEKKRRRRTSLTLLKASRRSLLARSKIKMGNSSISIMRHRTLK
jgi:hypothetical protein